MANTNQGTTTNGSKSPLSGNKPPLPGSGIPPKQATPPMPDKKPAPVVAEPAPVSPNKPAGDPAKVAEPAKPPQAPIKGSGADTKQPAPNTSIDAGADTKAKWQASATAANTTWNKLNVGEILQTEGNPQRLSHLVKERYGLSTDEADKQVSAFLAQRKLA